MSTNDSLSAWFAFVSWVMGSASISVRGSEFEHSNNISHFRSWLTLLIESFGLTFSMRNVPD